MNTYRNQYSSQKGILLTGATGFLGGVILEELNASDWVPLNPQFVPDNSVIIHLGASVSRQDDTFITNTSLDFEIGSVAKRTSSRVVYASTNQVYSFGLNCKTEDRIDPSGPYAISKACGELSLSSLLNNSLDICRLGDVFGVGQRHGNLFQAISNAVKDHKQLQQTDLGLKRRTYIHVTDAARAIIWIAQNPIEDKQPLARKWNIGYEESASVAEILQFTSSLTNIPIRKIQSQFDKSWEDIRTMQISNFPQDLFLYESFQNALASFIHQLKENQ